MYINPKRTPAVARRQNVELTIMRSVVKTLLEAGFSLSVFDGEEESKPSQANKEIFNALFNTDEDYLHVWQGGKRFGWVRFVYGNDGWDVICDYTTNLETFIGDGTATAQVVERYA